MTITQSLMEQQKTAKLTVVARGRGELTAIHIVDENSITTSIGHPSSWRQCLNGAREKDDVLFLDQMLLHPETLPYMNKGKWQWAVWCTAPLAATLQICLLQGE